MRLPKYKVQKNIYLYIQDYTGIGNNIMYKNMKRGKNNSIMCNNKKRVFGQL